jgi:glycosyltransferase involved in cell wall biosynthesis
MPLRSKPHIFFLSTMDGGPWGGSEELWSQTALRLASKGVPVVASVYRWPSQPPRITELLAAGIKVHQRPLRHPFGVRAWRKLFAHHRTLLVSDVEKYFRLSPPALVVLSTGDVLPPIELMELCVEKKWPFVTIGHTNYDGWWPYDEKAGRLRNALPAALRCYFVSKANQLLVEKRLSCELCNAEVVRNPFNVAIDATLTWPILRKDDELRLACVGRLEPSTKGQDVLLEVLAHASWSARPWRLTLYGDGPSKNGLERFCEHVGLINRVVFAGYVRSAEKIWSDNHLLVVPSRYEGLPMGIVEAMLCARPVLATNVGGISEIIEDGVTGFLAEAATVDSVRHALEVVWARRLELEQIGRAAAKSIRTLVPADPAEVFSNKLLELLGYPLKPATLGETSIL